MISLEERIARIIERQEDVVGSAIIGRAVTATLRVSPNGSGADGLSWRTAFTNPADALDVVEASSEDLTLILTSPHDTYYDIDKTGDPTWAAPVILQSTHRQWAEIRNTHADATSILKLTGKSGVSDITFNLGTGNNGLIMTSDGFRVYRTVIEGEDLTSAATALHIDGGTTIRFGKLIDCIFNGNKTYMKGLLLDNASECEISNSHLHACLTSIQIINSNSDSNLFDKLDICNSTLGLDIDAGNAQRFRDIRFFDCTKNVEDEVGDHSWINIEGQFNITTEPDNLVGVTVPTHVNAATWGVDVEVRAAATSTVPFRIVGVVMYPSKAERFRVRLSADSGVTFFDDILFDATKAKATAAPSGTEYIFNKGTRISASAQSVSGSETVLFWLKVQEI